MNVIFGFGMQLLILAGSLQVAGKQLMTIWHSMLEANMLMVLGNVAVLLIFGFLMLTLFKVTGKTVDNLIGG